MNNIKLNIDKRVLIFFGIVIIVFIFFLASQEPDNLNTLRPSLVVNEDTDDSVGVTDIKEVPAYKFDVVDQVPSANILYYPEDDAYHIIIKESPFEEARQRAEQKFLADKGLSENEACSMNVFITTSMAINPEQAGKNYNLSFCKGSYLDDVAEEIKKANQRKLEEMSVPDSQRGQ